MSKLIVDPNCKTCDGSGTITGTITIPVCCNEVLRDGSCCGNAVPEQEQILERCPECEAYEDVLENTKSLA